MFGFVILALLPLVVVAKERNCSISEPWRCDRIDTAGIPILERFFFREIIAFDNHDVYMCNPRTIFCRSFSDVKEQPKAGCYMDMQIARTSQCECKVFTNSVHPNLIKLLNWHLNIEQKQEEARGQSLRKSLCWRFAMFWRDDDISFEELIDRIDAESATNLTLASTSLSPEP